MAKSRVIKIKKIAEYLEIINNITQSATSSESKEAETQTFYRGQINSSWPVQPAIKRKGYEKKEKEIIERTLSDRPGEFVNCETMFEKLVKMQHYGIPTRILDLTASPLIALYFACEQDLIHSENNDADGVVYIYQPNQSDILEYNSDKVRLLANLARIKDFRYCDSELLPLDLTYVLCAETCFDYLLHLESIKRKHTIDSFNINIMLQHIKWIEASSSFPSDNFKNQIVVYNNFRSFKDLLKIYDGVKNNPYFEPDAKHNNWSINMMDKFNRVLQNINCGICISPANKYCKRQLLNLVREEKPAFDDRIILNDLKKNYFVRGIKANERIRVQFGDFIITSNLSPVSTENLHKDKVIISSKAKINILEELDKLGINGSTIYPEFPKYADYVKEKYK